MNEMNPLENQLRSWKPRRPSARLEHRLFPPRRHRPVTPQTVVNWLAPAMACLMFTTTLLHPRAASSLAAASDGQPMMAMILSNQSFAAYLPGSFQRGQNRWDTFEWTNQGRFGSSVAPFSPHQARD